jgi:hypothetical protein
VRKLAQISPNTKEFVVFDGYNQAEISDELLAAVTVVLGAFAENRVAALGEERKIFLEGVGNVYPIDLRRVLRDLVESLVYGFGEELELRHA